MPTGRSSVVAILRDVTERFIREKDQHAQLKALQAKTTGQPGSENVA
jgi:hypothetical protein